VTKLKARLLTALFCAAIVAAGSGAIHGQTRTPFQKSFSITVPVAGTGVAGGTATFIVPANKRLVITFVSARGIFPNKTVCVKDCGTSFPYTKTYYAHAFYNIEAKAQGAATIHYLMPLNDIASFTGYPLGLCPTGIECTSEIYTASEQVTVYADPGSTVTLRAANVGSGLGASVGFNITGYLIDPAASVSEPAEAAGELKGDSTFETPAMEEEAPLIDPTLKVKMRHTGVSPSPANQKSQDKLRKP
jgi:hypothetical protein